MGPPRERFSCSQPRFGEASFHHADRVIPATPFAKSPGPDDAGTPSPGDHDAMAKITSAKQLRELRLNAGATILLLRKLTPHLVKAFVESLAVQDRVRAHLPSRQRRTSRPLKIGLSAVGVVAAGAAAARLAGHHGPFGGDGPDIDRA